MGGGGGKKGEKRAGRRPGGSKYLQGRGLTEANHVRGRGGRTKEAEPSLAWATEILRDPAPSPFQVVGEQELKRT